ncbi:hypothetical protein K439DRAFT_1653201 [Ramaria rubella]|nr:hypothetical protein K439DRAFT_1653201 [Ramaria rubella]
MFFLALFALAAPLLVSAHQVHQVVVGSNTGALTFTPEAIFANPGDVVNFQFQQKNHSVVRSSFANPCGPAADGFNSGYMPVAPDKTSDFPEYNITVNDTSPIWVYCSQKAPVSHCHQGMVFAVNCGATGSANSFDAFKAAAIAQGAAESSSSVYAYGAPTPSATDAAPSSSITIPPAPSIKTVTATVTVDASTWTTTYGSYPNSPAPTPASLKGNVIKVVVGGNSTLTFNPSFVQALPRDTIVFEFQTKNHTVTQSTFADPCRKLDNATTGQVGFDSGFMPVTAGSSTFPTFNVTVNDTSPVWVYCKQTNPISHCGSGMVLSINSDETSPRSSTAFAALAKEINGTSNAAAAAAAAPITSASSSTPSPSPSQPGGTVRISGFGMLGFIALAGGFIALL